VTAVSIILSVVGVILRASPNQLGELIVSMAEIIEPLDCDLRAESAGVFDSSAL
jgi:hypothetical protein